jgi:two-component system cell cycle response regulator DivK
MNRDMLSRRLQRKGFEIALAVDGPEGVAKALEGGFDLILMDMSLPEIDGWEATRRVRASEAGTGRRVPIIALTAHAMSGDREKAMAAGCDDYDTKPVELDRLLGKIAVLLGKAE